VQITDLSQENRAVADDPEARDVLEIRVPASVQYTQMSHGEVTSPQETPPPITLDNRTLKLEHVEALDTHVLIATNNDGTTDILMFTLTRADIMTRIAELKQESVVRKTPPPPFVTGQTNDTESLIALNHIGKQSIHDLEARMRPETDSDAGFLGHNESLLATMAYDNELVRSAGLTHQQLSEPLFTSMQRWVAGGADRPVEFELNGTRYRVEGKSYRSISYRGSQHSPFADGTGSSVDITVINMNNGRAMQFPGLAPEMIRRYGFYEGKGTSYRVEPGAVVAVFEDSLRQITA
jgi:hypothetical protein